MRLKLRGRLKTLLEGLMPLEWSDLLIGEDSTGMCEFVDFCLERDKQKSINKKRDL